jgi:hypothetical protein
MSSSITVLPRDFTFLDGVSRAYNMQDSYLPLKNKNPHLVASSEDYRNMFLCNITFIVLVHSCQRVSPGCMLVYTFILGGRDKKSKTKELAMSANQSAVRTLRDVVGLSQKLFNTSADLSRMNATLRETHELLRDSTATSTSVGSLPVTDVCTVQIRSLLRARWCLAQNKHAPILD